MLDIDSFINEISVRPALWDTSLKEYSDRDLRSKYWIEIARIVLKDFDQMDSNEKNKQVKELQRKWKSLRDSFKRELRSQQLPSGSGKSKRKKYCYFDQLLFLVGTIDDGESATNLNSPEHVQNEDTETEDTNSQTRHEATNEKTYTTHRRNACKQSSFEMAVLQHIQKSSNADENEEADKHFLLSFLPMMKQMSVEKKLWARMKITEVVQQALSMHQAPLPVTSVPHIQPQPQYPPYPNSQAHNFYTQPPSSNVNNPFPLQFLDHSQHHTLNLRSPQFPESSQTHSNKMTNNRPTQLPENSQNELHTLQVMDRQRSLLLEVNEVLSPNDSTNSDIFSVMSGD